MTKTTSEQIIEAAENTTPEALAERMKVAESVAFTIGEILANDFLALQGGKEFEGLDDESKVCVTAIMIRAVRLVHSVADEYRRMTENPNILQEFRDISREQAEQAASTEV